METKNNSVTNQFLEETNTTPDILTAPLTDEPNVVNEETEEEGDKPKNRREKRLLERLEKRGEEATKYAEEISSLRTRLNNIEDSQKLRGSEEADYLKLVEKIYGTATPEAKEATEILKQALKGVHDSARKEALEEAVATYEEKRESEVKAIQEEEGRLDTIMESLEDEYNIDFSDQKLRTGYLTLLEQLSPKDKEGNIIEYADPNTTYEIFQSRTEKKESRAKQLASRSMTQSGASTESKLEQSSMERFLKENGII